MEAAAAIGAPLGVVGSLSYLYRQIQAIEHRLTKLEVNLEHIPKKLEKMEKDQVEAGKILKKCYKSYTSHQNPNCSSLLALREGGKFTVAFYGG